MDDMKEKIKKWAELIESERLEAVLEDIQMNICVQPDNKLNKYIFKLLLYLSHAADKCKQNRQNYTTGKRIAELAKLLCSLLIDIPDDKTYVISLYHIIRCLISFDLYKDAADICCYLQAESLRDNAADLLIKISFLWSIPINNIYRTLTTESGMESYNNLKSIVRYEIRMTRIAYKNYTRHLIMRISPHLDQIRTIDNGTNTYFDDFSKYILKCLAEMELHLDKDEKYVIYYYTLSVICRTLCQSINKDRIECAVKTVDELSSYFENLMAEDEECHQCFQQFRSICVTLLVPVVNFASDTAKGLQNFVLHNLEIAQRCGCTGAAKWNAISIAGVVESMFTYWETYIQVDKKQFLDTNVLLETMNLIVHLSTFFVNSVPSKCKSCVNIECTVKRDTYNAVVMKCRCINFLNKFPTKTLPKEVCTLARKMLEENVALIHEMRECQCKRWIQLWTTCGTLIYNMGIISEHVYEESAHLFSLLCTCIFRFQGIGSDSKYLALENPISSALHRLSSVHYTNGTYREAMTASALNGLLTYNESNTKAFHMWVNIKKKCAREFAKLTMLDCLRNDRDKISEMGLSIDISKYDLIQLCSREARSLLEEKISFMDGVSAVLDELRKLKPNNRYTHVIQLLGYYLLDCEYDSSVLQYHEQAISDLRQDKSNSIAILCLEANLKFFIFVDELHAMNKLTHIEMETTRFALCAAKLPEHRETKPPNVVPAYAMLNIKKDSSLMLSLQKSLRKWDQLLKYDINEIVKNWEPNLILCILVTAGEYSRLYRYEDCEAEAWTLAYKLASEINDYCTIIYVTGRSISLRQIDYNWIATAQKHAVEHKNSKDGNIIRSIAIFWISLADFYFECGKCEDAKKLLTDARSLPGVSFLANTSVYLLSLDIIIRNCNVYKDNIQHEDYSSYIVESLYAMVNLSEELSTKKWKNQTEYLFNYDVLFTATVNLSVRVNSLLSFREISAHLVRRVKAAQSLGAVIRIAEMLKSLCYIDLSRSKLDDCEVKLQGLEHMLDIETFQLSMNTKPEEMPVHLIVTPTKIVDPVRDVSQHGTSPVLGTKVFDLPKFALHTDCNCYKCNNVSYQYLVFTSTYIRAQLYALQNQVAVALDHFHGAFKIRQKLFDEKTTVLPGNCTRDKTSTKRFSWQARSYITDYVLLLIDFSYFLKINVTSRQQDAFDVANLAINICHKYRLEGHPLYMSTNELALDNDSRLILDSPDCLEFTVPQTHDIDISKYMKIPAEESICVTPSAQNHHAKKLFSVRRKRNPVILNLDKISMTLSDDEDSGTSSPPAYSTKKPKLCTTLIRRKLLEDDPTDHCVGSNKEDTIPIETKLTNCRTRDKNNTHIEKRSIKNDKIKIISSVSDISENLDLPGKSDATTENMDKLTEKLENFRIGTDITLRKKRARDTKQLTTSCNENVDQTIELLESMAINENTSKNLDSLVLMGEVNRLSIQDQKNSEIHDKKKLIKTSKASKQSAENESTTSISEAKIIRGKHTKPLINEVHGMRTRSNIRKLKEKPS